LLEIIQEDWVLATGETHTVKEFADLAFSQLDMNWEDYVVTSEKYSRPNEVHHLLGDASKAKRELNWKIETNFNDLVKKMLDSDLELAEREKVLIDKGLLKPTWEYPT
jgi:GDPmannose 4,6-dehydratase